MSWLKDLAEQGLTVFIFDLGVVAAKDKATATAQAVELGMHDRQTGPTTWEDEVRRNGLLMLMMDSAEAQHRLGIFGNATAQRAILRGDEK